MSDLAVETQDDVVIDTAPEAPVEEIDAQDVSPDTESQEGEAAESVEAPEETAEERIERLERESAGRQKKIDRQKAANSDLLKKLEAQRVEAEKYQQLMEQQAPKAAPDIEDFETHDEYVDALAEYKAKAQVQEQQQQFMQQQEQMRQAQVMQERQNVLMSQEKEYMLENPMYEGSKVEVQSYLSTLQDINPGTESAFIDQLYKGNVAEVTNYFGENNGERLDELGKIARMSPPEAAVETYKIQQKLKAKPTVKKEKTKSEPVKVAKPSGGKANKGLGPHSSGEDVLKTLGLKK